MSENFEAPDLNIEQLVDTDPTESAEWRASFDAALKAAGPVRARYLMLNLLNMRKRKQCRNLAHWPPTDYINTIAPEHEAKFPGDEDLERKIRRINRWNAAMLVHRAPASRCWRWWTHLNLCVVLLHCMKLVLTTSSADKIAQAAEIDFLPGTCKAGNVCTCIS